MKIRLLFSYQGTDFLGWQRQKEGRTAQGEVERALSSLFRREVPVFASGRTDRGAHALAQTAHFEISPAEIKPSLTGAGRLAKALNHLTAPDISFSRAWRAPDSFHARFSAEKKVYLILLSRLKAPQALLRCFVWPFAAPLDLEKLNLMSQALIGEHDFKSFQNAGSSVSGTVRSVFEAGWREISPSLWAFQITASGFLKQMARNIAGAQAAAFRQKKPVEAFRKILESRDRSAFSFPPAPASGLYLKEVIYPPALEKLCRAL